MCGRYLSFFPVCSPIDERDAGRRKQAPLSASAAQRRPGQWGTDALLADSLAVSPPCGHVARTRQERRLALAVVLMRVRGRCCASPPRAADAS
jgi:hypothetical protein